MPKCAGIAVPRLSWVASLRNGAIFSNATVEQCLHPPPFPKHPNRSAGAKKSRRFGAGKCSKVRWECPVDVHKAHQVLSALVMTRWSSRGYICCRSCGTKAPARPFALVSVAGCGVFRGPDFSHARSNHTETIIGMCSGPDRSRHPPICGKSGASKYRRPNLRCQPSKKKSAAPAST